VEERPDDAQAHFELGLVEFDNFHNDEAALRCFETARRLNPRLAVGWLFSALAQGRLGRHGGALESIARARRLGYATALVDETEADAHYNLGQFEAARRGYRAACRKAAGNAGLESKLGLAELRAGHRGPGLARLRHAVTLAPHLAEAHDRLIQALVWLDRPAEAAIAAEAKIERIEPSAADYARAASIRFHVGEKAKAAKIVQTGLGRFPRSEKLQQLATSLGPVPFDTPSKPDSRRSKVLAGGADIESGARSSVSRS
jgi:tetratricopeptide (TPR) repeat protein